MDDVVQRVGLRFGLNMDHERGDYTFIYCTGVGRVNESSSPKPDSSESKPGTLSKA